MNDRGAGFISTIICKGMDRRLSSETNRRQYGYGKGKTAEDFRQVLSNSISAIRYFGNLGCSTICCRLSQKCGALS